MMSKSAFALIAICLLAAPSAHAQFGGGGGGRHGGGAAPSGGPSPNGSGGGRPGSPQDVPADQIDIVGVVQSIDPATDRITIAYQAVDALDWPAGSKPFEVAKSALLSGVTVGEKVRFRLESLQIYVLQPYVPGQKLGPPPAPGVS
jgi:Copper binding periplasmic protein CusF